MKILVAYASRHGATMGIAERIAERLRARGIDVTITTAAAAPRPDAFDAVVIGAAAYMGHWMSEATRYVRRHGDALAARPVWLFSSGPIGTETVDAKGRDVVKSSRPVESDELSRTTNARELRVFYGAFDPDAPPVGLAERLGAPFLRMPAIRDAMPTGDFRDWAAIDSWADGIATALAPRDERGEVVGAGGGAAVA
jgi:menaquinone-dependent protoporphyrinogen oxidase